ncbi:MAG: transposase [Acidobacteriota bacterium]|nr:transposase [Acidobacteriota bacterium]
MRVGTRTALGRKWSPVGVRPCGRQKIGYEYLYLYVSVKPLTGELIAMFLPRLDKECFRLFADERSRCLERKILMLADGATAHRLAAEKIELVKLPAYAPELNRVERFFEQLRSELEFCVFETLDEAEDYLTKILEKYFKQPELVKSMTLYPHIKHAHSNLN